MGSEAAHWKIDSAVVDDCESVVSALISTPVTWGYWGNGLLPLNLYSLGSSFFLAILRDEDALEPAKLDRCDAASDSCDGR